MRLTDKQFKLFLGEQLEKQNKYKNKKAIYDGITFDSIKEKNRYVALKQMEKLGIIKNLQLQVKFELQPSFKYNGETIRSINYIADFTYYQDGKYIVEDVKGIRTKEYKIKKKLFLYKYQECEFREV